MCVMCGMKLPSPCFFRALQDHNDYSEKMSAGNKTVFFEPVAPTERLQEELKSGSREHIHYDTEAASGNWKTEREDPNVVQSQERCRLSK